MQSTANSCRAATRLAEQLGVSYKTAWFLGHRIRQMFKDGTAAKLTGIVEADETYIGGPDHAA